MYFSRIKLGLGDFKLGDSVSCRCHKTLVRLLTSVRLLLPPHHIHSACSHSAQLKSLMKSRPLEVLGSKLVLRYTV